MSETNSLGHIIAALDASAKEKDFGPLLDGVRAVLNDNDIDFHRIQLPMTKPLGFRHPTLWGVLLTWTASTNATKKKEITHEDACAAGLPFTGGGESALLKNGCRHVALLLRLR